MIFNSVSIAGFECSSLNVLVLGWVLNIRPQVRVESKVDSQSDPSYTEKHSEKLGEGLSLEAKNSQVTPQTYSYVAWKGLQVWWETWIFLAWIFR